MGWGNVMGKKLDDDEREEEVRCGTDDSSGTQATTAEHISHPRGHLCGETTRN